MMARVDTKQKEIFGTHTIGKLGFTLIELLVVISIISVLATVMMASFDSARNQAQDARRLEDLRQIVTAFHIFYDEEGHWIQGDSGCGFAQPTGSLPWTGNGIGDGNGWFNHSGPGGVSQYDRSIAQCLVDADAASAIIIDPTGGITEGYFYMKCTCASGTYVYARLAKKGYDPNATNGTCCHDYDSKYGMNHYVHIRP